jgi:hypothetical protein
MRADFAVGAAYWNDGVTWRRALLVKAATQGNVENLSHG